MGQVIEFRPARAFRASPSTALYRCARCGADLWNILPDGRVRCGDCEEECPFRTVARSDWDCELNKGE
jgi:DNA-directed RNA polymerase subunit RPC12/RpoP